MVDAAAHDVTRWWWIRHAPVPQLADRIYGNTDPEADVSDTKRLTALAQRLPPQAVWVVSHLRQTRQTAEALGKAGSPSQDILIEPAFSEQNFGVLYGVRHVEHEAKRIDPFRARVAGAIERISTAYRGRDVICVAHAGPIHAAIAVALNLSPRNALAFSIDPLSLTRLHRLHRAADGSPGWRLLGLNECP